MTRRNVVLVLRTSIVLLFLPSSLDVDTPTALPPEQPLGSPRPSASTWEADLVVCATCFERSEAVFVSSGDDGAIGGLWKLEVCNRRA